MPEGINGSNNIDTYKYQNPQLQKYDTDGDGGLSVFEIENISDEQGIETFFEDFNTVNKEEQSSSLQTQLETVSEEQGIISSLWNGLKCLTGIGSSTSKCEKLIEDFENGKISYEEASSAISEFQEKQKNSVNLVSNIATGVATVAVLGSAVMTGGLSLGIVAAAAGVGAATKAGLKFADRATNKVKGDALDGKQIAKDALSGAVDGAVSVATMGIGSAAVTGKTVATQSIKQTIINGAKYGAMDGAISGGVTGAGDYAIEAAFEDNIDFNLEDFAKSAVTNAAGGALAGSVMGGISSNIQYKNMDELLTKRQTKFKDLTKEQIIELTDQANSLHTRYSSKLNKASKSTKKAFSGIDGIEVSSRPKSANSIFEKLARKLQDGEITIIDEANCLEAIGDGIGIRIKMKSLTSEQSELIIKEKLKNTGIEYEDFIKYITGKSKDLDDTLKTSIDAIEPTVINALKEEQTKDTFKALIKGIENKNITITELNNYGDELSSYFTNKQLQDIADAYERVNTGSKLDIVSKLDRDFQFPSQKIHFEDGKTTVESEKLIITEKGAIKKSGYTSTQMNTKYQIDSSINGELQIRGIEVNEFADVEHIPYDIRQGKITEADTKYAPIFDTIKNMSPESYKEYNEYLTSVYNWLRLRELGITKIGNKDILEPVLSGTFKTKTGEIISDDAIQMLTRKGLTSFAKSIH